MPSPTRNISLRSLGFDTDLFEYRNPAGTYRCTIRHVEGAVFHLTQEGYVDDESVVRVIEPFRTIRKELEARFGLATCVVINDIPKVTGGSVYSKRYLKNYFAAWPGIHVIAVGAKGIVRIVGKILTRLVPTISIRMVDTIEEALVLAREYDPVRNLVPVSSHEVMWPRLPDGYKERFDQLFEAIGRISWDESFTPMQFDIPPDDPFHDVFSAVTVMHNDIHEIIGRLEKARGEAVEANCRKDRLVADVSHELRSPLTAITLMSDMLCIVKDPADMARYAGEIRAVARRMNRIVDDILEMSRMDAGRSVAAHVSFSLRDELSPLCEQFAAEAVRKRLRFETTWNGPVLRPIVGDPLKVTQVLTNLVGNAVKYTDAGFVTVSVHLRDEGDRGRVVIEVADSGVGIAPEEQRTLFDRFSRSGAADAGRRPGTGLGLAIARELARLMEGDILLSSEPGQGSVFSFTFPVEFRDTPFADETSADERKASAVYGEGGSS